MDESCGKCQRLARQFGDAVARGEYAKAQDIKAKFDQHQSEHRETDKWLEPYRRYFERTGR